jgi:hypothetical protein
MALQPPIIPKQRAGRSLADREADARHLAAILQIVPEEPFRAAAREYFKREKLAALGQPLELVPHLVEVAGECGVLVTENELREQLNTALRDPKPSDESVVQEAQHARASFARHWIRVLEWSWRNRQLASIHLDDWLLPKKPTPAELEFMRSSMEALTLNTVLSSDDVGPAQQSFSSVALSRLPLSLPHDLRIQRKGQSIELTSVS